MEFSTSLGRVRGADLGDVVHVSGLPYASPPLGALRFARPQPPSAWDGVLDATSVSTIPPQPPSRLARVMGDYGGRQSEDCLKLDLWIPAGATEPLPVIVFLHGGAFMTGGGALPCYDGAVFARRARAVVVNISYRLGVLGFLPIEGVAPANLGLSDQIAALEFIRREIEQFGGDAANVTVIGQSAGAFTIAAMLAMPGAKELFDRAVMISSPLGIKLVGAEEMRAPSKRFLAALGVDGKDRTAIAALPVSEIMRGQGLLLRDWGSHLEPDMITPPFMPTIDGDLIEGQVDEALADNPPTWCPIVIGATREEIHAFWFDRDDLRPFAAEVLGTRFEQTFPGQGAKMLDRFRARRSSSDALVVLSDLATHRDFVGPLHAFAAAMAAAGGECYAYLFDWQSPDPRIGACHCIELPFLFGNLETWREAPMLKGAGADELSSLSQKFQDSMISFARTGKPAGASGLAWPPYGSTGATMHFDRLSTCSTLVGAS